MKDDINLSEKRVTNAQMLAEVELHDKLERGTFSSSFLLLHVFILHSQPVLEECIQVEEDGDQGEEEGGPKTEVMLMLLDVSFFKV